MASGKNRKSEALAGAARSTPARTNPSRENDIGGALRAAYESAVNEAIPPEMLDLLSKLR